MFSPPVLSKLVNYIREQVNSVTCFQCCKYYKEPKTAACGHSLCHICWIGRRNCAFCNSQVEFKALQPNKMLQIRTENIYSLNETFSQHFNMKLDEHYLLDENNVDEKRNVDNVKDWLTNSQNHFSAPVSGELSNTQYENKNKITTKLQIHDTNKKIANPLKKVYKTISQHDWDVIEQIPDDNIDMECENIIGPKDVEPFNIDNKEYTTEKPRRSLRKRKPHNKIIESEINIEDVENTNNNNTNSNIKKSKEYSNTVKKMKKVLSNPSKNTSKLDISFADCKHVQELSSNHNSMDASVPQAIIVQEDKIEHNNSALNHVRKSCDKENNNYNVNEVKKVCDKKEDNNYNVDEVRNPCDIKQQENLKENTEKRKPDSGKCIVVLDEETSYKNLHQEKTNNMGILIENNKNIHNKLKDLQSNTVENANVTSKEIQIRMPFIKKSSLYPKQKLSNQKMNILNHINVPQIPSENSDDIEISIKVGNTITNIVIKKKENDVSIKMMSDQGIQTDIQLQEPREEETFNIKRNTQENDIHTKSKDTSHSNGINIDPKSASSSANKHTASAQTQTVEHITESTDKELANVIECVKTSEHVVVSKEIISEKQIVEKANIMEPEEIERHDIDIFDTESEVIALRHTPSEILMPTVASKKLKNAISMTKRKERENNSEEILSVSKKLKCIPEIEIIQNDSKLEENNVIRDTDSISYDTLISQVFANIDKDMKCMEKSQSTLNKNEDIEIQSNKKVTSPKPNSVNSGAVQNEPKLCQNTKNSNMSFSDNEKQNCDDLNHVAQEEMVYCVEQLTPRHKSQKVNNYDDVIQDIDDSDRSVVEETPEKNISLPKLKQKSNTSIKQLTEPKSGSLTKCKDIDKENVKSVICDNSMSKSVQNATVVERTLRKQTLETPMSIDNFVGSITYKSTPVAKKSLNFNSQDLDDPEQTLCASNVVKNTQEKEIMMKAFESTPKVMRHVSVKKYCVAGSCLTGQQLAKLRILCKENNWVFVDKYTKDLTHLVVSVDEDNMSQRSVKYMLALAASKWIVSFAWVERCLEEKRILNEASFEALDSTGEPGPTRSRITKRKVFTGFKFFCMPPFSILDSDILKEMLESSGGEVVTSLQQVQVTEKTNYLALLLAEPESTQEDRFVYLAMEHRIVPVNSEWVLNCLGSYSLQSIHDHLLCPSGLLPTATSKWPNDLLALEHSF